jgi:Na+/H+ antiporter NhaD/arsenite permease-like protein
MLGIPTEFLIFGAMLLGVAVLHGQALRVAAVGFVALCAHSLLLGELRGGQAIVALALHFSDEAVVLANLFALLLGFAVLARHFEATGIPGVLPRFLPDGWRGGLALLGLVFTLSAFLDNIAAAIIGGSIASTVFNRRVHVGFLAAIVAAANAGGAGSVIGDTTTTMMWIQGVSPLDVLHAYVPAATAFVCFAIPASIQQYRYSPIASDPAPGATLEWSRIACVIIVLAVAVACNILVNWRWPAAAGDFPVLGTAIWAALLLLAPWRKPDWQVLPGAARGASFLVLLVACASLMPVERLPPASWSTTFGLGAVSAVFDNIPLTKLALDQGGYDWGFLAYAVGFGGSMIWFGSSAGVAISSQFPQARSVSAWLAGGWHVAVAYGVGSFAMLLLLGWQPHTPAR